MLVKKSEDINEGVTTFKKEVKTFKVLISGLKDSYTTQKKTNENPPKPKPIRGSFQLPAVEKEKNDELSGRYIVGQIISCFTLDLKEDWVIWHMDTLKCLYDHESKHCRANSLRLLAVRMLDPNRPSRPKFAEALHFLSSWNDAKCLLFLNRFYDCVSGENKEGGGVGKHYLRVTKTILNIFSEKLFGPKKEWFSSEILGLSMYDCILRAVLKGDVRQKYSPMMTNLHQKNNKPKTLNEELQETENYIKSKGAFGILWQIRNRSAHYQEFLPTATKIGSLSANYINVWRQKYPLLMSAVYLIAINIDLHTDDSFQEFFPHKNSSFYDGFKNMNVNGSPLNLKNHCLYRLG